LIPRLTDMVSACKGVFECVKLTGGPASIPLRNRPRAGLVWLSARLGAWCWQGIGDLCVLDNHVTIREQLCKERLQFDLG